MKSELPGYSGVNEGLNARVGEFAAVKLANGLRPRHRPKSHGLRASAFALARVVSRSKSQRRALAGHLERSRLTFASVGLTAVVERDHARRSARRRREGKVGLTVSLKKSRAANS
jgi:hypothetical protein